MSIALTVSHPLVSPHRQPRDRAKYRSVASGANPAGVADREGTHQGLPLQKVGQIIPTPVSPQPGKRFRPGESGYASGVPARNRFSLKGRGKIRRGYQRCTAS